MAAGDPLRRDLGLWTTCSTVTDLPAGASVAADGFSLVHAIVGHELERRALPPIEMSSDPVVLHDRLRDAGATHVVLGPASIGLLGGGRCGRTCSRRWEPHVGRPRSSP